MMRVCICGKCKEIARRGDPLPYADAEAHEQGRDEFERCAACGNWASYAARAINAEAVTVDGWRRVRVA